MAGKKIEDISEEKLQKIRVELKDAIIRSNKKIGEIDREISRRVPFVSMHDKIMENLPRTVDTKKCIFWDCEEPPKYLNWISIMGETFSIRACDKHTSVCYEPRHRFLGGSDLAKIGE